jgi:cell division protein ZapA
VVQSSNSREKLRELQSNLVFDGQCILASRERALAVSSQTTVEIFGRRFELRATEASEHVEEIARFVDRRMRELAEVSPHVDTSKLAVLTALNIADELFKEQETEPGKRTEKIRQRVEGLIVRLDEVLTPSKRRVAE